MVAATRKSAIKIGTKFSYTHADSRSVFTVTEKRGSDTYQCEIKSGDDNFDWVGTKKVFGGEEIRSAIAMAKMWSRIDKAANDFWAARKVGEIVHYHNGFGQYVRGEIVRVGNEMKMRPIALVGNWTHDLPKRGRDGQVIYSHHVKRIRFATADSVFQPNDGSVWESPNFSKPMGPMRSFDPTKAEPLDLSDPAPLEGDAAKLARYEDMRMKMSGLLGNGHADPKAALIDAWQKIGALLEADLVA